MVDSTELRRLAEAATPGPWVITPEEAARHVILASPHPIPPPEQLDALHALQRDMQRSGTNWAREVPPMAARLRAALDAKLLPNGPPGNGLDDIRAAAMDQWDVPRAGEETAP